jgi:hypothetical protein
LTSLPPTLRTEAVYPSGTLAPIHQTKAECHNSEPQYNKKKIGEIQDKVVQTDVIHTQQYSSFENVNIKDNQHMPNTETNDTVVRPIGGRCVKDNDKRVNKYRVFH